MSFKNIFSRDNLTPNRAQETRPLALLTPKMIRQLDHLQLVGAKELRGTTIGLRPSFRRKPAPDFREHRAYVPGDDVRYVDWRASARHEQIFIKQGEHPKEASLTIMLDCSASMAWGVPPKQIMQQQLAAALAYLALAHRDRLLIVPYGQKQRKAIGPISGKGQMQATVRYLQSLRYGGKSDLLSAAKQLKQRAARGGLLFILSDLLGVEDLTPVLNQFPAPTWQVNVFHLLHPDELKPDLQGGLELVDVESGDLANYEITAADLRRYAQRLEDWQNRLDMDCVEAKGFYTPMPTDLHPESEMLAHLRQVKVVQPL
jgi:uncharacterized protein (DUF58 family)